MNFSVLQLPFFFMWLYSKDIGLHDLIKHTNSYVFQVMQNLKTTLPYTAEPSST